MFRFVKRKPVDPPRWIEIEIKECPCCGGYHTYSGPFSRSGSEHRTLLSCPRKDTLFQATIRLKEEDEMNQATYTYPDIAAKVAQYNSCRIVNPQRAAN